MNIDANHSPSNNQGNQRSDFALRFLRWFCPDSLYESIEGDLLEQFEEDLKPADRLKRSDGYWQRRAKRRLLWNVLKFFRPGIILRNKFSVKPNGVMMIGNYFKVALRGMAKYKLNTLINVTGLTIGLTVALVLFFIVRFEYTFEGFYTKVDRLYQIKSLNQFNEETSHVPQGAIYAAKQLASVEGAAVVYGWDANVIQINDENFKPKTSFFIHPEFLDMIDVKWLVGSRDKSLSEPYQVVLDKSTALQFFNHENPIGKTIRYDNTLELVVSGVIDDMPANTDFSLHMIMSYATLTKYQKNYENENSWDGGDSWFHGYILLNEGADPKAVEAQLTALVPVNKEESIYTSFTLVPLSQTHFDKNTENDPFTYVTPLWMINCLVIIGLFLIVMVCINFVNLSIARAALRSKEIGIRKAVGSNRSSIAFQFFTETAIIVTISGIIACLFASYLIHYSSLIFNTSAVSATLWDISVISYAILFIVIVSLLAGFYPALILSKFKPAQVLRNQLTPAGKGKLSLQKGLIITQFTVAQIMVIGMIVGFEQINFFNHQDLGFETEAIVTIDMPYKDSLLLRERFRNDILRDPSIKEITFGLTSPSSNHNHWWGSGFNPKLPNRESQFRLQWVDTNYFDFYKIPVVAGRMFTRNESKSSIIVNEKTVHLLGLTDPHDAIGEEISIYSSKNTPVTIIGVVKDYYAQGLKEENTPHLFISRNRNFQLAQIRIDPNQTTHALETIKKSWLSLHPNQYFDYQFLDATLKEFYKDDEKFSGFIATLAVVGISIGCLGLFGLTSFVCVRRSKEISVRKVFGATVANILILLSSEFINLVLVAFLISTPIAWLLLKKFLQHYAYHIELSWSAFALAALLTGMIALIVIIGRTIQSTFTNPTTTLKNE